MSLGDYKIKDTDVASKGVVAAPDKLTGSAEENKKIFDRLIRESVKGLYNGLVDALEELGVQHAALLPEENARMKYIRLGASGDIEVSTDGETWLAVAGSGASPTTVPAHAARHAAEGDDPLTPGSIGAYTQVETDAKIKAAIGDAIGGSY